MVTLSLITDAYIPRTEALRLLEQALGKPVSGKNLAQAHFDLGPQLCLSIEIPKFGEDLPLTLDLTGTDQAALRCAAMTVSAKVREELDWNCQLHEWETSDEVRQLRAAKDDQGLDTEKCL